MKQFELSEDFHEKFNSCTNPEELMSLASDEGIELTDAQLDQVAGGGGWGEDDPVASACPFCQSSNTKALWDKGYDHGCWYGHCYDCGKSWFPAS